MNRLETILSIVIGVLGLGIISGIFITGSKWESVNSNFNQMSDRLGRLEKADSRSICGQIAARHLVAVERRKADVAGDIERIEDRFGCGGWQTDAALTGLPMNNLADAARNVSANVDDNVSVENALRDIDNRLRQ